MKNVFLMGIVIWFCSAGVTAQNSKLEELCKSIREKVVVAQNPIEIFRDAVFDDDCVFQFSVKEAARVTLRVERYESQAAALVELKSQKESFVGRDALEYEDKKSRDIPVNIDPEGFWDTAVAHRNTAVPDHFILLRRDKYVILILGSNFSVMKKNECLLRNIRFD